MSISVPLYAGYTAPNDSDFQERAVYAYVADGREKRRVICSRDAIN
jgi:hypothetical protein